MRCRIIFSFVLESFRAFQNIKFPCKYPVIREFVDENPVIMYAIDDKVVVHRHNMPAIRWLLFYPTFRGLHRGVTLV